MSKYQRNKGLTCPTCRRVFIRREYKINATRSRNSKALIFCSKSCASKWSVMKGKNKSFGYKEIGEEYISRGYAFVKTAMGWVRKSRALVENEIGRKLDVKEHVHHKNGDTLDNRLSNLEVLDIKEHGKVSGLNARRIPKIKLRAIDESKYQEFKDLYEVGTTWESMAKHFGTCVDTIQQYKKALGLHRVRPTRKGKSHYE